MDENYGDMRVVFGVVCNAIQLLRSRYTTVLRIGVDHMKKILEPLINIDLESVIDGLPAGQQEMLLAFVDYCCVVRRRKVQYNKFERFCMTQTKKYPMMMSNGSVKLSNKVLGI
eukprot:231902_1